MPRGGNHNPNGIGLPTGEIIADNDEEKSMVIRNSLENAMQYWNSPIVKDEQEGERRTNEYLQGCIARGLRPTVEGWALALGTTRASLWDWETGRRHGPLSADFVKKGKELMASFDADMVNQGKMNPVTYIFRSKNYYGMKDQQDIVVSPKQEVDISTIIQEAEMLPDVDDNE